MKQQKFEPKPYQDTLPPELSALEASLASLEPFIPTGSREAVKSNVLIHSFESALRMPDEKLIETIVKIGDQGITLSLQEYVKSAKLLAGFYGAAIGLTAGLLIGISLMFLTVNSNVREIYHVPYSAQGFLKAPPMPEPQL